MKKLHGNRAVTRRAIAILTAVMAVFALMTTVGAQSNEYDISIPVDTVVRAAEGSKTLLVSVDVPAEAQGQTCSVTIDTANQESRHPFNDLSIESGSSAVVAENVEREPGIVIQVPGVLTLGSTVDIYLLMGPDEVFSGGLDVILDCETVETTTTTVEETTTTVPEETTTVPVEPTTTTPVETTTTFPDEVLPTEVTTTTVEVTPTEAPTTLPFTGAETENLALIALALAGIGALTLVATRTRSED